MNRQVALIELAPGQQFRISAEKLGVFFCGETFAFVLSPRTRRAAERVARWHGCEFRFYPATGHSVFIKRGRVPGTLISWFESAIQQAEHVASQVRLYAHGFKLGGPARTGTAAAAG